MLTKKKHKLSLSLEEDYCLLGISTDEADYKICWLISEALMMTFTRTDDLRLPHRKLGKEQAFSLFQYEDENAMLTYRIIGNHSDQGYFISELRNIDYLLHIQGDLVRDDLSELLVRLNSIKEVRMCVPVDLSKIRDKERLQLW